jgi:hypothetical protein
MTLTSSILLTALLVGSAQQSSAPPGLQPRPSTEQDDHPTVVLRNNAKSVLPENGTGYYRFEETGVGRGAELGEGVQLTEQFGDVTGYLTLKASPDGGKPTLQSYFFNHIEGGGGDFSFTTKAVHGLWYSFEGKIERGPSDTPALEGYYQLTGTLITHNDTKGTTQQRKISLKRVGQRVS